MNGHLLNTVEKAPWPCPHCPDAGRRLEVYTTCARWLCCGRTVELPSLHLGEGWARACRICTPAPVRAAS